MATETSKVLRLPSDRDVALAMAVVFNKPDDMTVRDYIALLRQHIAKGRRENTLSAAYRHLDRAAYWRAECERRDLALRASEAATMDGLREIEMLKAKNEIMKAGTIVPAKRKRVPADVVPIPRSPKRARRTHSPGRGSVIDLEIKSDLDDQLLNGEGCELMGHLCMINTYLKSGINVQDEAPSMTYYLVLALKAVPKPVRDSVTKHTNMEVEDLSALPSVLTAAGRVVSAVIIGLMKLSRVDGSHLLQSQVTHAFITMFDALLDNLHIISTAEITNTTGDHSSTPAPSRKNKTKAHNRVNIADHVFLNCFTVFLTSILRHLDARHDCHHSLFEGLVFVMIKKLGNNLHAIVFGHPPATVEESIQTFVPADDTQSGITGAPVSDTNAAAYAKLEAPYHLHLLKLALSMAPTFLSPAPSTSKSAKAKYTSKLGSITKTNLTVLAKERLQRTLVNAVFGTEGVGPENDMLLEALRMPVLGDARIPVPRVKETEVGEWFKEEVWRLLGWEVLGREVDG
ncbi:hypothetical protein B0A48_04660 [Cryoendolithus antarcticus]|uniref:Uncharacterized protein n=1 Tax=Cryoendolithus antarcticus TaxID=1507870 RepID=A0A1V8TGG0_9PEZI|nr:hypothetical protein B0A48_04660 [Cryoendolithus antarcticus]